MRPEIPSSVLETLRDRAARRGAAFRIFHARTSTRPERTFSDDELRRFEAPTQPIPVFPDLAS